MLIADAAIKERLEVSAAAANADRLLNTIYTFDFEVNRHTLTDKAEVILGAVTERIEGCLPIALEPVSLTASLSWDLLTFPTADHLLF